MADEFNRLVDNEYDQVQRLPDPALPRPTRAKAAKKLSASHVRGHGHPGQPEGQDRIVWPLRGYIEAYRDGLFAPPSWLAVYAGQGIVPTGYERLADNVALDELIPRLDDLKTRIADRVAAMTDHAAFVRDYCPSPAAVDPGGDGSGL